MSWSVADPRGGRSEFDVLGRLGRGYWWCHEMVSRIGCAGCDCSVSREEESDLSQISKSITWTPIRHFLQDAVLWRRQR